MTISEILNQPAVTAALVTNAATLLVAVIALIWNARVNRGLLQRRIDADLRLAEVRLMHEIRVAERKRELDEQAADWKRKADFAESIIADFCDGENRLRAIRNHAAYSSEAEGRPGREDEAGSLRHARDTCWPVQHRLQSQAGFFDSLHSKRFRARALFGADAEEPFLLIWSTITQIRGALHILLQSERPARADVMQRLEDTIWNNSVEAQPDALDAQSTLAVAQAEAIFGAYLSAGVSQAVTLRSD